MSIHEYIGIHELTFFTKGYNTRHWVIWNHKGRFGSRVLQDPWWGWPCLQILRKVWTDQKPLWGVMCRTLNLNQSSRVLQVNQEAKLSGSRLTGQPGMEAIKPQARWRGGRGAQKERLQTPTRFLDPRGEMQWPISTTKEKFCHYNMLKYLHWLPG